MGEMFVTLKLVRKLLEVEFSYILVKGNSLLAGIHIGNVSLNPTHNCKLVKNADVSTAVLQPSSEHVLTKVAV